MFERFTDRARRVVVLAQEETRFLGCDHIGTEHFLLGLIHEGEGVAAKVLEGLTFSLEDTRKLVEGFVRPGNKPGGHIPFSLRARTLCENSLREAIGLGHPYIGTEHLLLSMLKTEGAGRDILTAVAPAEEIRERVLALLASYTSTPVGRASDNLKHAVDAWRRPWRPGDADTRCQSCWCPYEPWFTDNWLWNEVMSEDGANTGYDPGGFLCPRCFADRASKRHPNLVWRFIPEWSGKASLMDFKKDS